jgi:DNA polymerase-3 subunit chi
MARIVLHELPGTKRAGVLARLVEELYGQGKRMVVWVADEGRRQILDGYLWTFRQLSFVPHTSWAAGMESAVEPVVLVGEAANPNAATVLVVGDDLPPLEWAGGFEEIHDLIPAGPSGEARAAAWRETGWTIA